MGLMSDMTRREYDKFAETPSGKTATVTESADAMGTKRVETVNNNLAYVGRAPHGSATSAAVWQIARITLQDQEEVTEYANEGAYDRVWDSRASYFGTPPWANSYCLVYDGVDEFLNLGDNLNKERTDSFSWSMWARFDNVTTAMTLYSKRSASGGTPGVQLNMLSNGRLEANLVNTASSNHLRLQMPNSILANTWYNIVWTFLGAASPGASNLKLYLNGTNIALSTITNNLTSSIATATAAYLGQYASGQYFDGKLDEVALWSKELSAAEVLELYNGGMPEDPQDHSASANLAFYLRMGDNDTFPTIQDVIGSVDATMTNMAAGSISTEVI